jgi:hypothetical protein
VDFYFLMDVIERIVSLICHLLKNSKSQGVKTLDSFLRLEDGILKWMGGVVGLGSGQECGTVADGGEKWDLRVVKNENWNERLPQIWLFEKLTN